MGSIQHVFIANTHFQTMIIDQRLAQQDPSRYTVHQMLAATKQQHGATIVQEAFEGMLLLKTTPSINALYNYAYCFKDTLTENDFKNIKAFFGSDPYRIKLPEHSASNASLVQQGFVFKDEGHIMVLETLQEAQEDGAASYRIVPVHDEETLHAYKEIFSEAFGCTLAQTTEKLGFLDTYFTNPKERRLNAYLLYAGDVPVSTGAYYAFDEFSIENIGTRKEWRGKGYANAIMRRLLCEAQALGYTSACLVASTAGAAVYRRLGFREIQTTSTYVPST